MPTVNAHGCIELSDAEFARNVRAFRRASGLEIYQPGEQVNLFEPASASGAARKARRRSTRRSPR